MKVVQYSVILVMLATSVVNCILIRDNERLKKRWEALIAARQAPHPALTAEQLRQYTTTHMPASGHCPSGFEGREWAFLKKTVMGPIPGCFCVDDHYCVAHPPPGTGGMIDYLEPGESVMLVIGPYDPPPPRSTM